MLHVRALFIFSISIDRVNTLHLRMLNVVCIESRIVHLDAFYLDGVASYCNFKCIVQYLTVLHELSWIVHLPALQVGADLSLVSRC